MSRLSLSCEQEVKVGVSWALNHTGGTIYGRTSAPGPVKIDCLPLSGFDTENETYPADRMQVTCT